MKLISNILNKLIKNSKQRILIPFYHSVTDTEPDFIGSLYPPRKIEDFEKDIDVLLTFYEPISLSELISIVKSNKNPQKNCFHLTFDDGLANFYEIVAPILLKKKIPATVFLNTDFIDNKELFYRYKASLLLNYYEQGNNTIKAKYREFIKGKNDKNTSVSVFLLSISFQNKDVLDDLAVILNYSFNDFLTAKKPYLTKGQISELVEQGITFGGHSSSHPLYCKLPLDEQITQTKNCINWMVDELGIDYKAFSFPFTDFGVSTNFYETIKKEGLLDISFGTSGIKRDLIENNFQRISFEEAGKSAKLFLFKAYIKYFLKILLRKNIMKRE